MRVPDVVSLKSETNPAGSFYIYADPESHELGTITNLEFARATHRVAHLVRPDHQGPDGEVVALLVLADTVLYHAVIAGLMTANFIVRACLSWMLNIHPTANSRFRCRPEIRPPESSTCCRPRPVIISSPLV